MNKGEILTMSKPKALIITAAGINCDRELAHAFDAAGAQAEMVHLNTLCRQPGRITSYQLIGIPGGFSYGDAVAAGRIMAQLMRQYLYQPLVDAVQRGTPIIAPCNGFQIAVQMGLLPGPADGADWPSEPPQPVAALAPNESGRFVDRWARVEVPSRTNCIWTRGLQPSAYNAMLPIAHGEGRFVMESAREIDALDSFGQVAIRYAADDNPNGSMGDIAGICDRSGLVFGLMPHPERYTSWLTHPRWTRLDASQRTGEPIGLAMFRQAVEYSLAGVVV